MEPETFAIHVHVTDEGSAAWWLEHKSCGWTSNEQDTTERRTMADLVRWMSNHRCGGTS